MRIWCEAGSPAAGVQVPRRRRSKGWPGTPFPDARPAPPAGAFVFRAGLVGSGRFGGLCAAVSGRGASGDGCGGLNRARMSRCGGGAVLASRLERVGGL